MQIVAGVIGQKPGGLFLVIGPDAVVPATGEVFEAVDTTLERAHRWLER